LPKGGWPDHEGLNFKLSSEGSCNQLSKIFTSPRNFRKFLQVPDIACATFSRQTATDEAACPLATIRAPAFAQIFPRRQETPPLANRQGIAHQRVRKFSFNSKRRRRSPISDNFRTLPPKLVKIFEKFLDF
jgi:hypothetical protein